MNNFSIIHSIISQYLTLDLEDVNSTSNILSRENKRKRDTRQHL